MAPRHRSWICASIVMLKLCSVGKADEPFKLLWFSWIVDPDDALHCASGNCKNQIKQGFNVVPMRIIPGDSRVVFQDTQRPWQQAALLQFSIQTQPGCYVSGCHLVDDGSVTPHEECFKQSLVKKPNQRDGSALMDFQYLYYADAPAGQLYLFFERLNYLGTGVPCSFSVLSGSKHWIEIKSPI